MAKTCRVGMRIQSPYLPFSFRIDGDDKYRDFKLLVDAAARVPIGVSLQYFCVLFVIPQT